MVLRKFLELLLDEKITEGKERFRKKDGRILVAFFFELFNSSKVFFQECFEQFFHPFQEYALLYKRFYVTEYSKYCYYVN